MKPITTEGKILQRALTAFREETGVEVRLLKDEVLNTYMWDGEIELIPAEHQQEFKQIFPIKIKRRITKETIVRLKYQLNGGRQLGLLEAPEDEREIIRRTVYITEYAPQHLAAELKNLGVQFIDTCGNVYINVFPIFIFIKGNRQKGRPERAITARAFQPKGLRVVFALLCNPGLENEPFREIAKVAGVALGTLKAVFDNLKATGYLIDKGRYGRKLLQKDRLLNRWIPAYAEGLRKNLMVGRFTTENKYWWDDFKLPRRFYWGGEVAAEILTQQIKPEIITIYKDRNAPLGELLPKLRIRKDPKGEIEILETFWEENTEWQDKGVVHPLLVYADLIATDNERNHEIAMLLKTNELYRYLE